MIIELKSKLDGERLLLTPIELELLATIMFCASIPVEKIARFNCIGTTVIGEKLAMTIALTLDKTMPVLLRGVPIQRLVTMHGHEVMVSSPLRLGEMACVQAFINFNAKAGPYEVTTKEGELPQDSEVCKGELS